MTRILIIGCGYAGQRVAQRHLARGDTVIATTRTGETPVEGVQDFALDLDAPSSALPAAQRVYYTAPPPSGGREDTRLVRCLEKLPVPEHFVYFGTTGVYGDRGGETVIETAPLAPVDDRARRRVHAEEWISKWAESRACAATLLRIAGIYGPDRLPLDRLLAGKPVPDPADTGPGNRIHVDDLATAAVAIADSGQGGTWNISDGNPLPVAEFNDLVADALDLPRPRRVPLASPEITPGMRAFMASSRYVDNNKLLSLSGFSLQYPDPAAGIRASLIK
ncbi:MAG: SDR family oxidoreductase [Proteobacteria bacterium]|nr:SDR family oxidoreductase [Pseudomonadota bacterium]